MKKDEKRKLSEEIKEVILNSTEDLDKINTFGLYINAEEIEKSKQKKKQAIKDLFDKKVNN